jgi:hypothetical protein
MNMLNSSLSQKKGGDVFNSFNQSLRDLAKNNNYQPERFDNREVFDFHNLANHI